MSSVATGPYLQRDTVLEPADNAGAGHARTGSLTLAGQALEPADEIKHFEMIGTTGTGKSTATRELLTGALARGDVILNPCEPRSVRWDLFGELETLHDADHLARSLIADTEGMNAIGEITPASS
jgi:hypothetical protein